MIETTITRQEAKARIVIVRAAIAWLEANPDRWCSGKLSETKSKMTTEPDDPAAYRFDIAGRVFVEAGLARRENAPFVCFDAIADYCRAATVSPLKLIVWNHEKNLPRLRAYLDEKEAAL